MKIQNARRKMVHAAVGIGTSLLIMCILAQHNQVLFEIYEPEALTEHILAVRMMYILLTLQLLCSLAVLTRSAFRVWEHKQEIRRDEGEFYR
ncbi:hypothetical protein [Paenibacillus ihbetae]|uniref:Uncharacterized protein n=1 Tax=Paenibacillus ihbetae TaxID=1870820 RepID=A0ABX3JR86_9BACL|nr:hypothetical protein [Paenibacillus ihbetae]OOC58252.1 hypothetical protein BBD40_21150 [Paenibacillus ihbetae]